MWLNDGTILRDLSSYLLATWPSHLDLKKLLYSGIWDVHSVASVAIGHDIELSTIKYPQCNFEASELSHDVFAENTHDVSIECSSLQIKSQSASCPADIILEQGLLKLQLDM